MAGNDTAAINSAVDVTNDEAVFSEVRDILNRSRTRAVAAVNQEMVLAYWEIGKRIHEAIGDRADYGKHLIDYLSERLTSEFGRGFGRRNLFQMKRFYETFPIVQTLSAQLSWSHYCILIRIGNAHKRSFYANECSQGCWSVRKLEREIHALCYERFLAAGRQGVNADSELAGANHLQSFPIKDPYVLGFLGLPDSHSLHESDLEEALINHMQDFLLELGTRFAFVGRQVRVSSDASNYYVDLVFYHVRLKCYVLIDLKTGKFDPRDIGQMDFYVRLFDDLIAADDDNSTVGIVMCAEGDRVAAKYSELADGRGLYATQYVTALPSEADLAAAVEHALQ